MDACNNRTEAEAVKSQALALGEASHWQEFAVLALARTLVRKGRVEDALKLLEVYHLRSGSSRKVRGYQLKLYKLVCL